MMRFNSRVARFLLIAIPTPILDGNISVAIADDGSINTEIVIQKWQEHEQKIKSFDFRWDGVRFDSGTIGNTWQKKPGQTINQPESTYPTKRRLVVDSRGRLRFEDDGTTWEFDKAEFKPKSTIKSFDGGIQTNFSDQGALGFPNLFENKAPTNGGAIDFRMIALQLALRPIDDGRGIFALDKLSPTEETAVVENNPVVILNHKKGTVWIDPTKDCVPVRYTRQRGGTLDCLVEISYTYDKEHGWLPNSWKCTNFSGGAVLFSDAGTVNRYSINQEIPDSEFNITTPEGTWVHNLIGKESYVTVKKSGRRDVLKGEYNGRNIEEIKRTNTGDLLPGRNKWRDWFIAVNIVLILALLVVVRLYRMRRAKVASLG
jgi:hypothetical protein